MQSFTLKGSVGSCYSKLITFNQFWQNLKERGLILIGNGGKQFFQGLLNQMIVFNYLIACQSLIALRG
ncbi:unnamed protein product [Paramecium pentaurelia]|uniref:Uncharacterized protein n=1 Tax=Paramecium pentaurelia TaxID=43138 RepID=A0A8S1WGE8_9CILI|nr:unnamed protein product [Paramecium pentaurelia]